MGKPRGKGFSLSDDVLLQHLVTQLQVQDRLSALAAKDLAFLALIAFLRDGSGAAGCGQSALK